MFRKLIGACVGLAMMGMAGTASATLIQFNIEYSTSVGTGSFVYDDVLQNITDYQADFGEFGSFFIADPIPFTDALIGIPPPQFMAASFITLLGGGTAREVAHGEAGTGGFFCLTALAGAFGDCFTFGTNTVLVGTYQIVAEIPEPSTLALFATGLALLAFLGWRQRRVVRVKAA